MTAKATDSETANVASIFPGPAETPITDELEKLRRALLDYVPGNAIIKFEYDGRLRLHIDVRRFEDVEAVEAVLPLVNGEIYHDLQRGISRHNSFLHRVTATVRR